jgi:hypothetical protein
MVEEFKRNIRIESNTKGFTDKEKKAFIEDKNNRKLKEVQDNKIVKNDSSKRVSR